MNLVINYYFINYVSTNSMLEKSGSHKQNRFFFI